MDVTHILREVYWHSLDGIVVADKDTVILDVNPAYEAVTGYSRDELIGRKTNIVRSGLTPPEVFRDMWTQLGRQGKWVGEVINRHKNGNLWYSFLSITRIVDEGGSVVAYVGIARDITQRKTMEQQLRQNLAEIQSARELAQAQANAAHGPAGLGGRVHHHVRHPRHLRGGQPPGGRHAGAAHGADRGQIGT